MRRQLDCSYSLSVSAIPAFGEQPRAVVASSSSWHVRSRPYLLDALSRGVAGKLVPLYNDKKPTRLP